MVLTPNEGIRGGLRAEEWRQRFLQARAPVEKLDAYLAEHPGLRQGEQAELERRRVDLAGYLASLEDEANRHEVPQAWRR